MLDFPADVQAALAAGEVNLFEAAQLARLTAAVLGQSSGQARRMRQALLAGHLAARGSGASQCRCVAELLVPVAAPVVRQDEAVTAQESGVSSAALDEWEDFDPHDATHLFWD